MMSEILLPLRAPERPKVPQKKMGDKEALQKEIAGRSVPRMVMEEHSLDRTDTGLDTTDTPTAQPFDIPDWAGTVERIRDGDPLAMTELYSVFTRGIRYLLLRSLGVEELDDRVHDCFVVVTEAIRSGELRDPARLMGYIRTVVRRHIAASIEVAITRRRTTVEFEDAAFSVSDWRNNPEQNLQAQQRAEIARRVFHGVSRRDREILRRFYLLEQPQEMICEEMGLSYNQFRLLKSRAKARFGKLGQRLAESGSPGLASPAGQDKQGKNKSEKTAKAGY
jgi:RNA polymerase sigma-70 factor (ECF subfamily)